MTIRNLRLTPNPSLTLAAIALSCSIALAQQTPPAPPNAPAPPAAPIERQPPANQSGPGIGQGMGHGPMRPGVMQGQHNGPVNFGDGQSFRSQHGGPMDSAFRIVPPGMWWKNPMVIQRLTLTPEQTKKMDDIFQQSRLQLIDLKANVEKQQVLLEPMLSANPLDSTKAMAQIDKVAQSRADLEKAHARMLLGIRTVLTPDQWTKLNDRRGFGLQGGPGTPDASGPPSDGGSGRARGLRRGAGPSPNTNNVVQPIDQP